MARLAYWRVEISRKIDRSISISIIRKWSGNALCSSICTCTYNISGNVNLNWRYLPQGLCKAHVRPMLRGYGPRIWPQMAQYFRLGTWMHQWKNGFYFPKEMHPPSSTEKETSSKLEPTKKVQKKLRFHQQKLRFPPKRSQNKRIRRKMEWSPVTKAYRLGGCGALVLSLHPSEAPLARHPKMGHNMDPLEMDLLMGKSLQIIYKWCEKWSLLITGE